MKKILFLLLLTTSIYAQNPTKFEKIKITSNVTSTTATKVNVQETDGTVNTKQLSEFGTVTSVTGIDGITVAAGTTTPVIGISSISQSRVTGLTTSLANKIETSLLGVANGVSTLDSGGKVPLSQINDVLLGSVNYKGTYNASTNTPALPAVGSGNKGFYYIVSTAGTQVGLTLNAGDWVISNGVSWNKVDNNNAVTSVNGFVGSVVLTKSDVGLSNVDNTSDANKPISTAEQNALNLKANIASPTLTGVPSAPTATAGTSTTQLATTAFVTASISVGDLVIHANVPGSYTLVLSDTNNILPWNISSSFVLTVPTNASVAFPIGSRIEGVIQSGLGNITVSGAGVTFIGNAQAFYAGDSFLLTKINVDSWTVDGISKTLPVFTTTAQALGTQRGFWAKNNGGFVFSDGATGMTIASAEIKFTNFNSTGNVFTFNPIYLNYATGNVNVLNFSNSINPTSGTATYNGFNLSPTINQTGGANGITRGVYINPTLTAAVDFRAIEVVAGKVLIPNGTTGNEAVNFSQLSSKVSGTGTLNYIPKWTGAGTQGNSSMQQDINGNMIINGGAGSSQLILNKPTGASIALSGATGSTNFAIIEASNDANPDLIAYTGGAERLRLKNTGVVMIPNLSGTGSRVVTADASGNLSATTANPVTSTGTIRLKSFTVASLPTGVQGDTAFVTDALAPSYMVIIAGGGSVVTPVFYNGVNWVAN